jgi:hypothetical protein
MSLDRQGAAVSGVDSASIVKRFDAPEQVLSLDNGRLDVITVGGRPIGKGSYGPGWRWSRAAKAAARGVGGAGARPLDHVGVVLSGRAKVAIGEGEGAEIDLTPGDFFQIAREHDFWVVGYRPCEILYLSGVEGLVSRLRQL